MERISALIEKLREQFAAGADIEQLLLTSQLLEGELRYHLQKGTVPSSPHVAVVLPGNHRPIPRIATAEDERPAPKEAPRPEPRYAAQPEPARPEPRSEPQPEPPRPEPVRAAQTPQYVPQPQQPARPEHERYMPKDEPMAPAPQPEPIRAQEPVRAAEPLRAVQPEPVYPAEPARAAEPVRAAEPARAAEPVRAAEPARAARYNPIREVPTLTHQIPQEARGKELNEVIAAAGETQRSLNDAWKEQQTPAKELSSKLNESPVRDLRKAVGINDRYLFISELFRGDETMYERSIKTINNFSIFQEAYYWMERELKLKLAWDQDKHSTQLFYQLVRRRFSA